MRAREFGRWSEWDASGVFCFRKEDEGKGKWSLGVVVRMFRGDVCRIGWGIGDHEGHEGIATKRHEKTRRGMWGALE